MRLPVSGSPTPLVTIHLWGLPTRAVPWALGRMAATHVAPTRAPGLGFARWLGTGHGRTFTVRDADPRHWALVASWESAAAADAFERHRDCRAWDDRATERWRLQLRPLRSTGRWSGAEPFVPGNADDPGTDDPDDPDPGTGGPVAVLTRARIATRRLRAFHRAVPAVAGELAVAPGLRFTRGIGEWPIGLQATLSVWDDLACARAFAYAGREHRAVVARARTGGWFTESLFARFAVVDAAGTVDGKDPLGGRMPAPTGGRHRA